MPEFGGLWKRYTPSVHYRLGSPTLSQLAFHREGNPNFPWEKSHFDNLYFFSPRVDEKLNMQVNNNSGHKVGYLSAVRPTLKFTRALKEEAMGESSPTAYTVKVSLYESHG